MMSGNSIRLININICMFNYWLRYLCCLKKGKYCGFGGL